MACQKKKDSPLSAAINNTPEMLLAHVAPEMVESSPALALSARVANADAPLTETASTLHTILHDHRAAERRAKECSRYGHIWLALDMLESTGGGCALGREELERWVLHQVSGRVSLATRFRIGWRRERRLVWHNSSSGKHRRPR